MLQENVMQYLSRVTQKGQITIPAPLRKLLDLHTGERVQFEAHNGKVILVKQKSDITEAFGLISSKRNVSLKAMQEAIEKGGASDID